MWTTLQWIARSPVLVYLFSILPLAVFLAVLKFTDSFTLVTWKHILWSFCAGVAVCFTALFISRLSDAIGLGFYSPLVEETLKFGVLVLLVARRRIVFVQQALCYGAAIGAGFAFAENLIYINAFDSMSAGTALFRGMGTAVMHMACPMIAATFLSCAAMLREAGDKAQALLMGFSGFASAVGIHALFNLMLLPLWAQLALTLVVFAVLVNSISTYNERCVCKWLDQSINNDISLLKAIRNGCLSETKQGQYLLTARSQFNPDMVADMMCYTRLYLELIIEEKSRLMLREAGMEVPRTAQQIREHEAVVTEFRELRRRIGKAGENVLRPIVRVTRDDAALIGVKPSSKS